MAAKKTTKGMSAEHKAALAEGRAQGRAIREYLEALEAHRPKRGRKRTADSIKKRLERVETEILEADPMKRVALIQERMDLENELAATDGGVDLAALERDFVKYAKEYSARKGISYHAWREVGVSPATLKAAGITRGSGPA
jgi:uncharacterized protein YicC (UPF0701 family)